jgi:2-keto-4-pentenoate hydratase
MCLMNAPKDTNLSMTEDLALRAAAPLLDARRTHTPITQLPEDLRPVDMPGIYAVQDAVAAAFGEVGGWKIGAPTAEATPLFAPMPAAWISASGSMLGGPRWRYRGLEAEIAFLVGQDMPPRELPYTREEALDAMQSCHPAIEVLESAFVDPAAVDRNSMLADLQMHGGFVYGDPVPNWRAIEWNAQAVTLTVDGVVRVERTGSNTSGDLLKLLPWLANEGAARTGGLRKGQWITTGSWTGNTLASSGSAVDVAFAGAGGVSLRFE